MWFIQRNHCVYTRVECWTTTNLCYDFWDKFAAECSDIEPGIFSLEDVNQRRRELGLFITGASFNKALIVVMEWVKFPSFDAISNTWYAHSFTSSACWLGLVALLLLTLEFIMRHIVMLTFFFCLRHPSHPRLDGVPGIMALRCRRKPVR